MPSRDVIVPHPSINILYLRSRYTWRGDKVKCQSYIFSSIRWRMHRLCDCDRDRRNRDSDGASRCACAMRNRLVAARTPLLRCVQALLC